MGKTDFRYYASITEKLNVPPACITMVGDSLERDVQAALKAGLKAVWFNQDSSQTMSEYLTINQLDRLI